MAHKCEHGKDSDVCVLCATEFDDRPRGVKTADLGRGAGRPLNDSVAASGHIHLRVVMARKNWYVRMARLHNLTLAEWMQRVCDQESGYPPKSQLVTANKPVVMRIPHGLSPGEPPQHQLDGNGERI